MEKLGNGKVVRTVARRTRPRAIGFSTLHQDPMWGQLSSILFWFVCYVAFRLVQVCCILSYSSMPFSLCSFWFGFARFCDDVLCFTYSVLLRSVLFCSVVLCSTLLCSFLFWSVLFFSDLFCSDLLCSSLAGCIRSSLGPGQGHGSQKHVNKNIIFFLCKLVDQRWS